MQVVVTAGAREETLLKPTARIDCHHHKCQLSGPGDACRHCCRGLPAGIKSRPQDKPKVISCCIDAHTIIDIFGIEPSAIS